MDLLVERMRDRGIIAPDEELNPALGVVPSAMEEMLDSLAAQHGDAKDYLATHGVAESVFDRLAELLLEQPGETSRGG